MKISSKIFVTKYSKYVNKNWKSKTTHDKKCKMKMSQIEHTINCAVD